MPHGKEKHVGPATRMPKGSPAPMKNNGPRAHGGDHTHNHARALPNKADRHFPDKHPSTHLKAEKKQDRAPTSATQRFFHFVEPTQSDVTTTSLNDAVLYAAVLNSL